MSAMGFLFGYLLGIATAIVFIMVASQQPTKRSRALPREKNQEPKKRGRKPKVQPEQAPMVPEVEP